MTDPKDPKDFNMFELAYNLIKNTPEDQKDKIPETLKHKVAVYKMSNYLGELGTELGFAPMDGLKTAAMFNSTMIDALHAFVKEMSEKADKAGQEDMNKIAKKMLADMDKGDLDEFNRK